MPCRLIAENAGLDGTVVVSNIRRSKEKNYGYNAETGEYGDLRKAGVVDPVKVTRSALQNGASVACLLAHDRIADRRHPRKGKKDDDHHDDHHGWRRHGRNGRRHGWHGRHGRNGWHGRHGWNGQHEW